MQHARSVSSAKNDVNLNVKGCEIVKLRVYTKHTWIDAHLENAFYVPDLSKNLNSFTAAASRGMTVEIIHYECVVKRGSILVAPGRNQDFLIHLNVEVDAECHVAECETEQRHHRLCHASYDTVNAMIRDESIKDIG